MERSDANSSKELTDKFGARFLEVCCPWLDGSWLVVVARDILADPILVWGPDEQDVGNFVAGDKDSGVGAGTSLENLFTRSESKSSSLLITVGSRIECVQVAGDELGDEEPGMWQAVALGSIEEPELEGGGIEEVGNWLEGFDCFAFSDQ